MSAVGAAASLVLCQNNSPSSQCDVDFSGLGCNTASGHFEKEATTPNGICSLKKCQKEKKVKK